jgi:hypothetical protein
MEGVNVKYGKVIGFWDDRRESILSGRFRPCISCESPLGWMFVDVARLSRGWNDSFVGVGGPNVIVRFRNTSSSSASTEARISNDPRQVPLACPC